MHLLSGVWRERCGCYPRALKIVGKHVCCEREPLYLRDEIDDEEELEAYRAMSERSLKKRVTFLRNGNKIIFYKWRKKQ